jgi:flavin-dependent dehydrogenase
MSLRALVVGAGPAGLAAAARLATDCDAVTVVDAAPRERRCRVGEHLPPAGLTALAALGLAALIDDPRHEPSPGVRSAWGDADVSDKEYFSGLPGYGLNLRREVFDAALARHAEGRGASLLFATRLDGLARAGTGCVASLRSAEGRWSLPVDLVVDASGRQASAARRLGAKRRRLDRMVAIIGKVEGGAPADEMGRVHVESVADGWWYAVPFSNGAVIAALCTDAACVQRHAGGAQALWRARLAASRLLAPLVQGGEEPRRVQVVDAAVQWLDYAPGPGLLAVGDAAAAYDPLSSWGITKALCDGHAGAEALLRARQGDQDALRAHRHAQLQAFRAHRSRRRAFYAAESRWPAAPFWRSNRPGTPAAAGGLR